MSHMDTTGTPSLDDSLSVLAHPDRRVVLETLFERSAVEFSALERRFTDRDASEDRFAVGLVHVHLPKLEANCLVRVDRDRNTVERGPQFEAIRPLVEFVVEYELGLER